MPRLSPFHGLVFDAAVAGPLASVTAPPYDVISDQRRLEYLHASPYSVVHLDLAEGSPDPHDPASRYARAAEILADWEHRGAVRRSAARVFYAYEMASPGVGTSGVGVDPASVIRGLICAMTLEDWGGTVVPHERVMEGPVQDRLALLRATRTHLSPVYGTVSGPDDRLEALVRAAASDGTPFEAIDEQGVRHRMWPVPSDAVDLTQLADEHLLIADGHHRYTTALHYRDERRRADGSGGWDAVLTLVVDAAAEHLPVLPFHRVQRSGRAPALSGDVMSGLDETLEALADDDLTVGVASLDGHGNARFRIRRLAGEPPTVRALHEQMLDELAPAGSLRYTPDASDAVAALRRDDAVAAYLLPATTSDRIRAVVERGERLPEKSTYFWPKPRTGMVMMPVDRVCDPMPGRGDRAS